MVESTGKNLPSARPENDGQGRSATAPETIPLRLIVLSPPAGVAFAVQLGRTELLPPARRTEHAIFFEFTVQLAVWRGSGGAVAPAFRKTVVQGKLDDQFVYLNSGRLAGDAASPWERRAKIRFAGITPAMLATWREAAVRGPHFLAARVAGRARSGGPACAGVPLLGGGWRVETLRGGSVAV